MNVDLDGLATAMKAALHGQRRKELTFMVGEMVRHIKELEAIVDPLEELLQAGFCMQVDREECGEGPGIDLAVVGQWGETLEDIRAERFTGDTLAAALKAAVEAKRAVQVKERHD